ncbi:MAG: hypothetical protein ACI9Q4_000628, partial [Sediminicola sp.]
NQLVKLDFNHNKKIGFDMRAPYSRLKSEYFFLDNK